MKLIRITTENEISVHDFPEGSYREQNEALRKLIGPQCDLYEHVMPRRLYTAFHMTDHVTKIPGQCVSMLVDEEGSFKDNEQNLIGSYLYETDKHGNAIWGNILFVGEKWGEDGIDFCGIEDSVLESLKVKLDDLRYEAKKIRRQ